MPYTEDQLLPISALQHLLFCERQCALIHLERVWVENRWTAEGRVMHKKAHSGKPEVRDGVRITRGLPLRCYELGLTGQADVVACERVEGGEASGNDDRRRTDGRRGSDEEEIQCGVEPPHSIIQPPIKAPAIDAPPILTFPHASGGKEQGAGQGAERGREGEVGGRWMVTPIEYNRGRPKKGDCDRVQLCAHAWCLEEMLGVEIVVGEIYYGRNRRRTQVTIDEQLRQITRQAAERLHALVSSGRKPLAVREKKCETCSLLPVCLPPKRAGRSATRFLSRQLAANMRAD